MMCVGKGDKELVMGEEYGERREVIREMKMGHMGVGGVFEMRY